MEETIEKAMYPLIPALVMALIIPLLFFCKEGFGIK